MAKITTSFRIEQDIFQRGKIRAIEKGTTFSKYIQTLVEKDDSRQLKRVKN